MFYKIAFIMFYVLVLTSANEGDSCVKNGVPGTCTKIRNCKSAIEDLTKKIHPQICSFIGTDPVVCCPTQPTPTATEAPITTTTHSQQETNEESSDGCEPLSPGLTSKKIGRKAWDKCVEYQQSLVFPCKQSILLVPDVTRNHLCQHNLDGLIWTEQAYSYEFSHMVLLGYGEDLPTAQWLCAGSLISDQWILTAGHCTHHRELGRVSFARVGVLKRSDPLSEDNVRRIAEVQTPPNYRPPSRYDDIALLKMDRPVKLSEFLVPACIHIGDSVADDNVLATGWDVQQRGDEHADNLKKVLLQKVTDEECRQQYYGTHLMQELRNQSQVCYGDAGRKKDNYQGDSGSPIQIKSAHLYCMYVVTGVRSHGSGDSALYTRVAPYADWVEGVVWP